MIQIAYGQGEAVRLDPLANQGPANWQASPQPVLPGGSDLGAPQRKAGEAPARVQDKESKTREFDALAVTPPPRQGGRETGGRPGSPKRLPS